MARPTYIIYAPPLNLNVGGVIALHYLAEALIKRGEKVMMWPAGVSVSDVSSLISKQEAQTSSGQVRRINKFGRMMPIPSDINDDAIVIYPEVSYGNPLGARNVVRWLLNKPGRFTGTFKYEMHDLFFKFSDYADDPDITKDAQLLFLFYINPVYRNFGCKERSGSCYSIRKSAIREQIHPQDAICIDGLPHEKIAQIFSRCEMFYCYDEATMYSQYAAICGCLSVVVPGIYKCRSDWVRDRPVAKYGVAFGLHDLEHARATQHLVMKHLQTKHEEGLTTVRNFILTTRAHFGFSSLPDTGERAGFDPESE